MYAYIRYFGGIQQWKNSNRPCIAEDTGVLNEWGTTDITSCAPWSDTPLSLGSSGWFSQYMSYEDSKDFLSKGIRMCPNFGWSLIYLSSI